MSSTVLRPLAGEAVRWSFRSACPWVPTGPVQCEITLAVDAQFVTVSPKSVSAWRAGLPHRPLGGRPGSLGGGGGARAQALPQLSRTLKNALLEGLSLKQ